ncbi:hypothetical protein Glove_120g228 [Diversispora epigaea]|uniref:AAA-ATPase-like domain-containing protein n=1 Tax=Diversispora epigaea TaxID=1348612 RepID=A0A397J863_9GLOM|nr:hypothetical protein Glove_120g228 [Diversispora epigaea]
MWRNRLLPHSFHFPLFYPFPRFLWFLPDAPSSKPFKILSDCPFVELREESGYYLDKTHFIAEIESLNAKAILSLCPRRFGKTLFLSTLSSYYDIKNKGRFKQLFGDLYIGNKPTPLASSFLVLDLNFSGLRTDSTYEIFVEDFYESLNADFSRFMYRYEQELGSRFYDFNIKCKKNALTNFKDILYAVELSGHKLYVCIDEYDAGMNEALKNETILRSLTVRNENNENNENEDASVKIESIDNSFKQFYSRLKSACNMGIARVFQVGVTPVALAEFTSGFNISKDIAIREGFWDLYGFKKSEIELLLDNALGLSDVKGEIIEWLKEENDGYFFNPEQTEGIFNPARVLYCIEMMMERKKKLVDNDYQNTSTLIKKLLRFPSDPQTLPSQTTLELIVNNPLGKSILTEALDQRPLKLKKNIEQRFRLTNIRELATDRTPLLSFMFYTGALTYKPGSAGSLEYELQIPNHIAKREFIAEALKIYNWKEEDPISVRKCLQILEGEDNIEPLCRFIEKVLLEPLKDNSVVYSNEEVLKQTFMNTFILTYREDIEPEFQVLNFDRKAIDLIKKGAEERIAIEFGNIKIGDINFGENLKDWKKATKVSLSLLEKSEDEILDLETVDFKTSNRYNPNLITIRKFLNDKIDKCNVYLTELKNRNDVKLKSMFIVLRSAEKTLKPSSPALIETEEDLMEISPQMTEALQNKDNSSSPKNAIEPTPEICFKCSEAISQNVQSQ